MEVFLLSLVLQTFAKVCKHSVLFFNPLTPKDPYSGRTASLTSKVAFYIFIQQI